MVDKSENNDQQEPEATCKPEDETTTDEASTDKQLTELKEQLMRQRAEFDNFRKRSIREKEQLRKFAVEDLIVRLLDVCDNFERALESGRKSDDVDSVVDGVEMVFKQFTSILEQEGLERVRCEGEEFDPHLHDAMSHIETSEYPDNCVVEVCKPGYMMNSKVIRHAQVMVSKNPEEEQ